MLSNPRSERVRQVAALGRRAARERSGMFLVEGPQAVRELLGYAAGLAQVVYVTSGAGERWGDLVALAGEAGVRVEEVTDEVLAAMADTGTPQGMVAVARRVDVPLGEALDAVGGDGFAVVLAHVRDPGNAGTVLRGADAFGASAVLVSSSSVDVYNPKVVRSTVGSMFHVPVSVGVPVEEILAECRRRGVRLLAADGAGSVLLPEVEAAGALTGPHAWVMGNEAWGLPEELRERCDDVVAIPIVRAESLNLAMAATVCLHASASARR